MACSSPQAAPNPGLCHASSIYCCCCCMPHACCMPLTCWRQLQHPASCTQHSPGLSCCLRRSCPTPDLACRDAWCCPSCCCSSQGVGGTTRDACHAAEQLQPVLHLHQQQCRKLQPAAAASAVHARCLHVLCSVHHLVFSRPLLVRLRAELLPACMRRCRPWSLLLLLLLLSGERRARHSSCEAS